VVLKLTCEAVESGQRPAQRKLREGCLGLNPRLLGVVNVVGQVRSKMNLGSITLMSGLYSTRPVKGGAMGAAGFSLATPLAVICEIISLRVQRDAVLSEQRAPASVHSPVRIIQTATPVGLQL
jgi:hypothetical protein